MFEGVHLSNPIPSALDALREAVTEAEAVLSRREAEGASPNECLALAADVYVARGRVAPALSHHDRADLFVNAVGDLFAAPTSD